MKIIPITERWNQGEQDWTYVENPSASISAWEQKCGVRLPTDYRNFLLKFNGGRVFPRRFYHGIPSDRLPGVNRYIQLGIIYAWKKVMDYQVESPWRESVPPDHIVIADTPGEVEVLMSLEQNQFGAVFSWMRSGSKWGTPENCVTYPLAKSFSLFLKMQFDDEGASDLPRFARPVIAHLIRDFEIDSLSDE